MERFFFVLVEAALELAPEEIWRHPAVTAYAARRGKKPGEVLLDRSYHHAAMKALPGAHKRGRPDIAHFTLLEVLGSPLNKLGLLEIYVHTQSGHVIYIHPETRLPRVYERFKGLLEKLYVEPIVESSGKVLLKMERKKLKALIDELSPDLKLLLSERGEKLRWRALAEKLTSARKPMVMLGGFPRGDFEEETRRLADMEVSLYPQPLEAWTAASRLLCILETRIFGENLK